MCSQTPETNKEEQTFENTLLPLRNQLREFASECERKLRKNDHKTEWRNLPVKALLRKLEIELEELKVAIEYEGAIEARSECCDVANFAMMLWDRLDPKHIIPDAWRLEKSPTDDAERSEMVRKYQNISTPVTHLMPSDDGLAPVQEYVLFRHHGQWVDGNRLVSNMYQKDGDKFTLYYEDVPEVRARGTLKILPKGAVIDYSPKEAVKRV